MSLKAILIGLVLWLGSCWDTLNREKQIWKFYEQFSHVPIIHVYYNRHFKNNRQFEDFLEVIEEVEYKHGDYVRVILTDCELFERQEEQESRLQSCQRIHQNRENRVIVGLWPSNQFINYGGKLMQNPPNNKIFDHPSGQYTSQEIGNFISEMLPNFWTQVTNINQWRQLKGTRYVPKLVFLTRQEEVPTVLKQLSIHFYLRFELAFVSDLTESVVKELNIREFPTLLTLQYNFKENIYQLNPFLFSGFSQRQYQQIKSLLEPIALNKPRNDILFHQIKMPKSLIYNIVEQRGQMDRLLEQSSLWVIISQFNQDPIRLPRFQEKYGRFFEYLHYKAADALEEKISLYDPQLKRMHLLTVDQVQFKALNAQQFISNASIWLNKNFVVIGVRQHNSHFCTISLATLFRGFTQCLIIKQEDRHLVEKDMGSLEFGFVCSLQTTPNQAKPKVSGQQFKNANFEEIYTVSEYQVKMKSKHIIDDFIQTPIKPISRHNQLKKICNYPTKKCGLVFIDPSKKDQTTKDYISEIAKNYINDYQFFEIDINCNQEFLEEIAGLKKNRGGLIIYHPTTQVFVFLKAKISKHNLQQFLKINLTENKKLPTTKFSNPDIQVHSCSQPNEQL